MPKKYTIGTASRYVVNVITHEVHGHGCSYLPDRENRETFNALNPKSAINEAIRRGFSNANKCGHCRNAGRL